MTTTRDASHPDQSAAEPADVIIVGAGITGLATAVMLLDAGRRVIVLEQDVPGALASGRNTGKASLLQGNRISTIRQHHPARLVRAYVDANRAGQQWLRRACERAGVAVREATAYSYAQSAEGLDAVDAEVRAGREVGLPVRRVDDVDDAVPFPLAGAAALDGQLALDPAELMRGLADLVVAGGGRIETGVRVLGVRAADPVRVRTSRGEFVGRDVVIATGAPILDRGLYWAKTGGHRSMLVSFAPPADMPDGLYLSVDSPSRSIRSADWGGRSRLIVGGGDHATGREPHTGRLLDELVAWTRAWWPHADDPEHWAAQDYRSFNEVPFVGRMPRGRGRVWFATGYAKWGLTNGASAAIRITHEILGARRPDWARVIGTRLTMPADLARGVGAGAATGVAAARGWIGAWRSPEAEFAPAPAEGQGVVRRRGARPVGVSRVAGETCEVSAVCTHLGGVLQWNEAEATWDCPLHASRFDHRGHRIEGPAVRDLERIDVSPLDEVLRAGAAAREEAAAAQPSE
ncbi:FAD-dependent oxidoreductase [Agromyces aurantiacus]|uniref:FAD-dependent oxidoreductase n=1 Tax=Agromyces aurantiacus TaxID=165814 RepID=A0ABV9R350_9MICO|nr:FAD-dependent oxidoreductase [Agromyces aurantiacus]MBM7503242.1 glycine/D-amino acid oxidase-like deaminating enzyme/nitrite reductase/ring-hydroxylating ferredoxin subunit [Agromyces aurantiacus]